MDIQALVRAAQESYARTESYKARHTERVSRRYPVAVEMWHDRATIVRIIGWLLERYHPSEFDLMIDDFHMADERHVVVRFSDPRKATLFKLKWS